MLHWKHHYVAIHLKNIEILPVVHVAELYCVVIIGSICLFVVVGKVIGMDCNDNEFLSFLPSCFGI